MKNRLLSNLLYINVLINLIATICCVCRYNLLKKTESAIIYKDNFVFSSDQADALGAHLSYLRGFSGSCGISDA